MMSFVALNRVAPSVAPREAAAPAEREDAIREMRRALTCLYLDAPESVAGDVAARFERVVAALPSVPREPSEEGITAAIRETLRQATGEVENAAIHVDREGMRATLQASYAVDFPSALSGGGSPNEPSEEAWQAAFAAYWSTKGSPKTGPFEPLNSGLPDPLEAALNVAYAIDRPAAPRPSEGP